MISSIFDPLGFAALLILEGRMILQGQWDSEVNCAVRKVCKNWATKLKDIEKLHVRRFMKPDNFGKLVNVSLHHFSDASEFGCGQCSYIRMVNEIGRVYCSLLQGKSRDVPEKFISIPRLELNAVVLSIKIACLLKKKLNLEEIKEWFWIDRNHVRRFETSAANRIQQIRQNTDVQRKLC